VDDVSFMDMVTAAVPRGWYVSRPYGGPWVGVRRRGSRIPSAGWKLHVSATVGSATEVLARALPVLFGEGVPFKVAASSAVLAALNEGDAGIAQVGKFITVYPADDGQAVRLASALDEATTGARGPRVISDHELRPRSLVHYRYGLFGGRPDDPEPPEPEIDPFLAAGVASERRRPAVAGRYVLVSAMHRSVGGQVYLALDMETGRRCVVKRAERDARVGPDGNDARDRLRHEAETIRRLEPDPRFPAVLDLVEDDGDLLLVLELIEGTPLGSALGAPWPTGRVVTVGRQLASALRTVHEAGLVYRDLNPLNVILAEGGEVRIVDFELAGEPGSVGEAAGTPGFASPQQLRGEPATIADDLYALGALLRLLATGVDPSRGEVVADEALRGVVSRCLEDRPGDRYGSMAELDAALAQLEAET
jgi:class IV lanthipeptide synthase